MTATFTTGTITQASAALVGEAMGNQIRDDVVAHPAWELVEEYTPGGGLVKWHVFKCLASESDLPRDLYIIMSRVLSSGVLRFYMCEGYDSSTHTMTKYAWNFHSTNVFNADGQESSRSYVLSTSDYSATSGFPKAVSWTPAGTTVKWWLIAEDDGFTLGINGTNSYMFKCGAFIPLCDMDWPMPVMMIASSDNQGFMTNNPAAAGITNFSGNTVLAIEGGNGSGSTLYGPALGFQGNWTVNDKLITNRRSVAEQGIVIAAGNLDASYYGYVAGKQKNMRLSRTAAFPGSLEFGDAFAIDGNLWVPWSPTDPGGRLFNTGVES